MQKGKAFFVVGHRHWGKSHTLKALTGGRLLRSVTINGKVLFIRRMSNDDPPIDKLLKFILESEPSSRAYLIIALCADFDSAGTATTILDSLKEQYDLFFWVLKYGWFGDSVTDMQINELKRYGHTEVFMQKRIESDKRARNFKKFIEKSLD